MDRETQIIGGMMTCLLYHKIRVVMRAAGRFRLRLALHGGHLEGWTSATLTHGHGLAQLGRLSGWCFILKSISNLWGDRVGLLVLGVLGVSKFTRLTEIAYSRWIGCVSVIGGWCYESSITHEWWQIWGMNSDKWCLKYSPLRNRRVYYFWRWSDGLWQHHWILSIGIIIVSLFARKTGNDEPIIPTNAPE